MLGRIKDRIFGGKANISSESKPKESKHKHKGKKNPKGRPERTELKTNSSDRVRRDFDDEFRRNDVNAFELVITNGTDLSQANEIDHTQSPPATEQIEHVETHEPPEKSLDNGSQDSQTEADDEVGSLVDLVHLPKQEDNKNSADLSLEEIQTLDILDSVVNDLENLEYDESEDPNEDILPESRHGDENPDVGDIMQSAAESAADTTVNYDAIIGNLDDQQQEENLKSNNWKMAELNRQKSFRFVSSKEMYLPSPQYDMFPRYPDSAPELPPTDYPEMEDELENGHEEVVTSDDTNPEVQENTSSSPSPTVTSFSSKPAPTPVATSESCEDSKARESSRATEVQNGSTGSSNHSASKGVAKIDSEDKPLSATKRPKPRVTSFKSSINYQQTLATGPPINDLVKKFENFHVGEAF